MSAPHPTPAAGRRYLGLVLPHLATDRIERSLSPEARLAPRVVVALQQGTLRLIAGNGAATALGLEPGLTLADARARHPELEVSEEAPRAVARLLAQLADACERYTPLIALEGRDGLLLDVTGCTHLFGGEQGLVRDLLRRVAGAGLTGRAALAATAGAAFALARFAAGRGGVVVPPDEDLGAVLAPLPLAALGLEPARVDSLARLGFRRIDDVRAAPRAPLAARFGAELLRRLDEALGRAPMAVDYRFPPPAFCVERALPEPVERVEDVLGLATHLATTLSGALERHGVGARRLDLTLFRVDGKVTRLAIGTSRPLREPEAIRRLFAEKVATLSSLEPGFGFELLRLAVRETGPLTAQQDGFGAEPDRAAALDGLMDRLAIRFGAPQVQRLVPADRHLPEEACPPVPAQGRRGWAEAAAALALPPAGAAMAPGMASWAMASWAMASWADDPPAAVPFRPPAASTLAPVRSGEQELVPEPVSRGGRLSAVSQPARIGGWEENGVSTEDGAAAEGRALLRMIGPGAGAAPAAAEAVAFPPPQPSPASGRGSGGATAEGAAAEDRALLRVIDPGAGAAPAAAEAVAFPPPQPSPASERGSGGAEGDEADATGRAPLRAIGPGAAVASVDVGRMAARPSQLFLAGGGGNCDADGAIFRESWRAEEECPDLAGPARPLRLLEAPEPVEAVAEVPDGPPIRFRWRRQLHPVVRAEGPERIAAEWWRAAGDLPTRDYFRVETASGHRFWLFRAGLYGREAGRPTWFLHGLFG
ncbi:Y-family DNA polymerase [Xanthobacter sp. ZOL 2024]